MIYLQLFISFIQVGLFSVGGGYAAIPLIEHQVIEVHPWLNLSEFTNLITIAEMTPGPIAVNSATFVGIRIAGIGGAIVATFGCILPSCIIASILAFIYYRYKNISVLQSVLQSLRPAVVALIACAGVSILQMVSFNSNEFNFSSVNWVGIAIFAVAFFTLRKFKLSPILVMICCGIVGLLCSLIFPGITA